MEEPPNTSIEIWKDSTDFVRIAAQNVPDSVPVFGMLKKYDLQLFSSISFDRKEFEVRKENNLLGLFSFFFIVALVFAWYYQKNYKTVFILIKSEFSNVSLHQLIEDRVGFNALVSSVLFLLSVGVLSVFCFQLINIFHVHLVLDSLWKAPSSIFILFILILVAFFAKALILLMSMGLFGNGKPFNSYVTLNMISYQFSGLMLYPITVLVAFSPYVNPKWLLIIGGGFLVLSFGYRLLRMFILALKQAKANVFHIILYICALEILPILILFKIILG